jgi:hypothetical protein
MFRQSPSMLRGKATSVCPQPPRSTRPTRIRFKSCRQ